ncbi:hypothetical protein [Yeosuana marina]|uniref:hypothetical protein n=1 Tax=Yeosuana marina TaxID=1565536 RepID=UPI0030EC6E0E|tara:strand:- start:1148 stop:1303 length:156 start_codon:yes stop_codon:yes gene_type:complete
MKKVSLILLVILNVACQNKNENIDTKDFKTPVDRVNVFLGTSADHGQLTLP